MKKIILSPIFLLTVQLIFGQNIKFGIKTGLNISNTSNYSIVSINYLGAGNKEVFNKTSNNKSSSLYRPHIEFFSIYTFNEKFSFQPEVSLSLQGVKIDAIDKGIDLLNKYPRGEVTTVTTTTAKVKFETISLNIPLLMRYKISKKMDLIAGPQVNVLLKGSENADYHQLSTDYINEENIYQVESKWSLKQSKKDLLNPITLGICAGTNFALTEKLFLEARYVQSLINDFKKQTISIPSSKTSVLQASIGYIF